MANHTALLDVKTGRDLARICGTDHQTQTIWFRLRAARREMLWSIAEGREADAERHAKHVGTHGRLLLQRARKYGGLDV